MTTHAHHQEDLDWDELGAELERGAEVNESFLRGAAGWLADLASDVGRVLDVGSGPGVASCHLAKAFPAAEVVAVDGSTDLLERATARAAREGVADRVTAKVAELPAGLDDADAADLVWTSHVVHHLGDQQAALARLASLVRPGGLLAVAEGGLPMRFLPRDVGIGRPGLAARLDVAREEWFNAMRASMPDATDVVEDWPAMLAACGLDHVGTRTFLTDLPAPVDDVVREHLRDSLERQAEQFGDRLAADDRATVQRLVDRDTAEGILNRQDVFLLVANTVHVARAG